MTPYLIKSVKGGPGDLDYKAKVTKKAAFGKDVTADTIDAMTQVVERGSGSFAQDLGRPVAGKTGSTTDNKAAWFDGFTPQLATAVGIYKGNGTESMSNLPRLRRAHRWHRPGAHLDRLHGDGAEGPEGPRVPEARRPGRRRRLHAAADHDQHDDDHDDHDDDHDHAEDHDDHDQDQRHGQTDTDQHRPAADTVTVGGRTDPDDTVDGVRPTHGG